MTKTTKKQKLRTVSNHYFYVDNSISVVEKKAFRAKMKGHYKGEFNMASLLKQKPVDDDEDEDD